MKSLDELSRRRPPSMLDLLNPVHRADPYPLLHALRDRSPFSSPDGAAIVLGRYDDCRRALRNPAFSSRQDFSVVDSGQRLESSFLVLDPPDHTRLRRLVSQAFTPRAVARLRPRIVEIVDESLEAAAVRGSIDVMAEVANRLPITIISEWLGVPAADNRLLQGWTNTASRAMDPYVVGDSLAYQAVVDAEVSLERYFRELVAQRRRARRDDLICRLIEVEERGEHLTTGELLATINLLLVAGHETAANLIGNGVLALLRHPAELDRLRGNPALAGAVVEEALRYDAPVQMATRVTTAPARFAGVEAAPGTRVIILLAAANRDPAVHDEPDRFFPGRENQSHLAFSSGPHFCLGAGLARLEGELAFSRIFDRLINPRLAPDGLEYRPHLNLRGPGKLVVEFDGIRPPRP